jgi:RNA recognition motif-containing protein
MTGGFGLSVLISDPTVKAQRTDASDSTLFIGGLSRRTTEADVQTLVREVSLPTTLLILVRSRCEPETRLGSG